MTKNRPIAVKNITAFHAIAIFGVEHDIEDRVYVSELYEGEVQYAPRACKIRYNQKGEPYFNHLGQREYIKNYIKVSLRGD